MCDEILEGVDGVLLIKSRQEYQLLRLIFKDCSAGQHDLVCLIDELIPRTTALLLHDALQFGLKFTARRISMVSDVDKKLPKSVIVYDW